MKLKQVVDSLEGLPEWAKEAYTKGDDGKFYLDVDGLPEMRTALKEANGEAAKRRKELERYKDVDPEKYAELLKKHEEATEVEARRNGEFDKLREQMATKHKEELARITTEAEALRSGWKSDVVDARVEAAILAEKGKPHFIKHAIERCIVVEFKDGKMVQTIMNPDGSGTPMIMDASGKPADLGHLVKHFKSLPEWGDAFEGTGSSGGGTHQSGAGSSGGAKTIQRAAFEAMDPASQMSAMKAGTVVTD